MTKKKKCKKREKIAVVYKRLNTDHWVEKFFKNDFKYKKIFKLVVMSPSHNVWFSHWTIDKFEMKQFFYEKKKNSEMFVNIKDLLCSQSSEWNKNLVVFLVRRWFNLKTEC